ncbi:hypothetical protein Plec18167_009617 [Paecilomyces lecythidis]|uniref:RNase H type-1 domain-containing protein n=1 Tax=Paecilomyces lecythidis TaxID=3004212 RepID=A0ABR3WMK0_9EURO
MGVPGNEAADQAAKDAALLASHHYRILEAQDPSQLAQRHRQRRDQNQAPPNTGPEGLAESRQRVGRQAMPARPLQTLTANCRQQLQTLYQSEWVQQWAANPHGSLLRKIPTFASPGKKLLELHIGLRRAASSAAIQLQTGKVALGEYLASISAAETNQCHCGLGVQDVDHILTKCPIYRDERRETLWVAPPRETDYRRILSQAPLLKRAAQFILNIRILGQFRCLPVTYKVTY